MNRIFNIYFEFEGMVYNAVVSVRTTPFQTEYTLKNFNENLLRLLPGDKILSPAAGEFIFQNTTKENSIALMNAIIKAVAEHMHHVNA